MLTNLARPIESTDGKDLHSQLISLRHRVEELELENERLRSQTSSCRCSKENDMKSYTSEFANSNGAFQRVSQGNIFHATETAESTDDVPLDNSLPFSTPKEPSNDMHLEKRAEFVKLGLKDQPGCEPSTLQFCAKRYIALKIMYFGKRFYGFASEAHMDPTIESEVFKALERTKLLVGNRVESKYSRCGRTDKGVSSTGQVISLYLRSNLKDTGGDNRKPEIDYVKVLNRVLPPDIRVIGWCPISTDFSARFNDDELWAMTIKGSAFLWHQVRCMVAVLFMVGHGLESPDVLDVLLDTTMTPRKPQYSMAPELPLILRHCEFNDVEFICSSDARRALHEHLTSELRMHMLQAAIYQEALNCLTTPEENAPEPGKKKKGHVSLLQRPTEPSYEERCAKLGTRATQDCSLTLNR